MMFIINPMNNMNNKILHDKVLTAGWDRLACIWDVDTGELLQVPPLIFDDIEEKNISDQQFVKRHLTIFTLPLGRQKKIYILHLIIFSNWLGTMRS